MGVSGFLLRRVAISLGLIIVSLSLNFLIFRLLPGNPVALIGGPRLTASEVATLKQEFGLSYPLWQQYFIYIQNYLTGNWGNSFYSGLPIIKEISERIVNTVLLVGLSSIISGFIGLFLALSAGKTARKLVSEIAISASVVIYSFPVFWLGLVLILIFGVYLGWFPVGGTTSALAPTSPIPALADYLYHLALPLMTLILSGVGTSVIITRGAIVQELKQDYVVTSKAIGLTENQVLFRHVLRNSLLPLITFTALNFGYILAGAVLVEIVFSWNGLGLYIFNAIENLDYPALQASFFLISLGVIVANLLADLAYAYLDPRIRSG
jgi:peptide/nickel transport system permease protein